MHLCCYCYSEVLLLCDLWNPFTCKSSICSNSTVKWNYRSICCCNFTHLHTCNPLDKTTSRPSLFIRSRVPGLVTISGLAPNSGPRGNNHSQKFARVSEKSSVTLFSASRSTILKKLWWSNLASFFKAVQCRFSIIIPKVGMTIHNNILEVLIKGCVYPVLQSGHAD